MCGPGRVCGARSIAWFKLPDLPVAVYDLRAAADPDALYVFGGHLCELKSGYPFFYTNQVQRGTWLCLEGRGGGGELHELACRA